MLVSVVLTGCVKKEVVETEVEIGPDVTELLVSPETVKSIDLEPAWSNVVPLAPTEQLESIKLVENRLYAFTSENYVMSMDKVESRPVVAFSVAPAGFTINGWAMSGDKIYSVISSDLVEIDWRSGTRTRSKRLGFAPICPPVSNRDFYYVAGVDKRLHVLQSSDMIEVFEVAGDDDAEMTDVIASDDAVIFATRKGLVTAMLPDRPVQLWKFSAARVVNAPMIRNGAVIYFSSEDTNIYAVDARRGKLIWKYLTAALLKEAPRVTNRFVYQHVDGRGLLVIDKASGELAWRLTEGKDLLAETESGVYVLSNKGEIILVDTNKGKKVASVALPQVSLHVANAIDGRIYLADRFGRIICLQRRD
jgi:outer membrane protein assembly factor BamB